MFKPAYGSCIECASYRVIVVKKGYCGQCNERIKDVARKSAKGTVPMPCGDNLQGDASMVDDTIQQGRVFGGRKRKSPIKVHKKSTGERQVFLEIWADRPHRCQCCNDPLGDEPKTHFFSHLLSKGAYAVFRLLKLNVMLMCYDCHHEWDCGDKSQEKFKLARVIVEKLKRKYYDNR